MLRTKGHKGSHGRGVASLDPAAQELPALAEAEGVDSGGGADDGICGDVLAELIDLGVDVAPEGGALVGIRVSSLGDDMDESARVDGFGEGGNGLETFVAVGVAETCVGKE